MIIKPYTDHDHTEDRPRHRARAEEGNVRVWVGPYSREDRAITKAAAMVRAAIANGQSGDFIVDPATGSFTERRAA